MDSTRMIKRGRTIPLQFPQSLGGIVLLVSKTQTLPMNSDLMKRFALFYYSDGRNPLSPPELCRDL